VKEDSETGGAFCTFNIHSINNRNNTSSSWYYEFGCQKGIVRSTATLQSIGFVESSSLIDPKNFLQM
jgi:hypothetical protein